MTAPRRHRRLTALQARIRARRDRALVAEAGLRVMDTVLADPSLMDSAQPITFLARAR